MCDHDWSPWSEPGGVSRARCTRCLEFLHPKPATAEPPEWIAPPPPRAFDIFAEIERMAKDAREKVCGITDVMLGKSPDPIAAFNARRVAKRESRAPTEGVHPWAAAGHTHAEWSTDACPKCLLTGQEVRERGYYPKCDDYKRERETSGSLDRACRLDLHHPIHERLMPYRGHR